MFEKSTAQTPAKTPELERRRTVRLDVSRDLRGTIAALDAPLPVQDLSEGGFSVHSPVGFVPDSVHQFTLTGDDGTSERVVARTVHSLRVSIGGRDPLYVTGFEFLDAGHVDVRAEPILFGRATSADAD